MSVVLKLFIITKLCSAVVFASLYANNYPYSAFEYSNGGSISSADAQGQADRNAYIKDQQHNVGKNVQSNENVAKFYNKDSDLKGHDVTHLKSGTSVDDSKRSTGENFETDKSHNRKQVKSGFRNTYNKDESGSNSSFYEDSDDRGEKLIYDKRLGNRGDAYDTRFRENVRDGLLRDRGDDRYGGNVVRGTQDQGHLLQQNQGNSQGYRDNFNRGHDERYQTQNERATRPQIQEHTSYNAIPLVHDHGRDRNYGNSHFDRDYGNHNNHGYGQDLPPLVDYRQNELIGGYPQLSGGGGGGGGGRGSIGISGGGIVSGIGGGGGIGSGFGGGGIGGGGIGGGGDRGQLYDNRLPPPLPILPPRPPLRPPLSIRGQQHEDQFYTRPSITIYDDPRDDPREAIDPRHKIERKDEYSSSIRGSTSRGQSPRLDFRPSPMRLRHYYDDRDNRDNLRFRDRDY